MIADTDLFPLHVIDIFMTVSLYFSFQENFQLLVSPTVADDHE